MGIGALTDLTDAGLTAYGINPVVHSLVIDGIFKGVGSVLAFLPIIVTLFFFLSILEDSGYMARVAFVMDKLLRKIGLSGRSIVPMLIGFGCTVPGVMASRTLPSERDRKMTILLTPFMSCSAKLPIYGFFSAAFFPEHGALVMIILYFTGILVGILFALLARGVAFRGEPVPFVMELPNYRLPGAKNVGQLLWEKAKDFLERAFTVIFVATIVIWCLQTFDMRLNVVSDSQNSLLAMLAGVIAPVFCAAWLRRLENFNGTHYRLHGKGKRCCNPDRSDGWNQHYVAFDSACGSGTSRVLPALHALRCGHYLYQEGTRRQVGGTCCCSAVRDCMAVCFCGLYCRRHAAVSAA